MRLPRRRVPTSSARDSETPEANQLLRADPNATRWKPRIEKVGLRCNRSVLRSSWWVLSEVELVSQPELL